MYRIRLLLLATDQTVNLVQCVVQANLFKVVALATPCVQFHGTKVGRRDAVVIGPGNRTIIFPDGSQWVLGTTVNTTYAIAPSGDPLARMVSVCSLIYAQCS